MQPENAIYMEVLELFHGFREFADTLQKGSTHSFNACSCRYDMVAKAGIPSGRAHLEQHFPGGIALSGAYVDASALQALDAAVDEALEAGAWADCGPLAPPSLSYADAADLLGRCPAAQALGAPKFFPSCAK